MSIPRSFWTHESRLIYIVCHTHPTKLPKLILKRFQVNLNTEPKEITLRFLAFIVPLNSNGRCTFLKKNDFFNNFTIFQQFFCTLSLDAELSPYPAQIMIFIVFHQTSHFLPCFHLDHLPLKFKN